MKFRYHRGSLEESMETAIEVDSVEELTRVLVADWNSKEHFGSILTGISFKYCALDGRIGWDTWYVLATATPPYPEGVFVIGMSTEPIYKPKEYAERVMTELSEIGKQLDGIKENGD